MNLEEEVDTENSLDREAVIHGADLDLEAAELRRPQRNTIQPLGECIFETTDTDGPMQHIFKLSAHPNLSQFVRGEDRGLRTCVKKDLIEQK